ncbi:MAG: serine/threonine-protein kinase [Planctomycetota bacterium]
MSNTGNAPSTRPLPDMERVHELFVLARRCDPDERNTLLTQHCGADEDLRREVEDLLAHDRSAANFLANPVWRNLAQALFADLAAGDVIGGYRLESVVGQGGTSRVFAAVDPRSGRRVALKVVALGSLGSRTRARFAHEVECAMSMHHPHLVEVLDAGEDSSRGLLYCAMRLVDGPTLAEVLGGFVARRRPPEGVELRTLVERFAEIASALAALHDRGLVHRDVKPSNIVFEAGDTKTPCGAPAVLVDFGLVADTAARGSSVSTLWASIDYAAPEQLAGRSVTPAVDVFALGVTMHDLLAGRSPVARERSPSEGLERLGELVPGIDPDLAAIVATACDPEPRWRHGHGGALLADLRAHLEGRRVQALRVPLAARASRFVLRHPRRAAIFATRWAVALLAVALLTLVGEQFVAGLYTRHATATALRDGDLMHLDRLTEGLGLLQRWLLPAKVAELLDAGSGSSDPALRSVSSTIAKRDWTGACLLAASHLERDGVRHHPELAQFLANTVRTRSPIDGLPLVARLFFERPDADLFDLSKTAVFRSALRARFDLGDPVSAMHVVVAWAGCGDIDSLAAISHALSEWSNGSDDELECTRVAVANSTLLIRRLAQLDPLTGPGALELETQFFDSVRRAVSRAGISNVARDRLDLAVAGMALQFARLHRAERRPSPTAHWETLLEPTSASFVRAALRDPELVASILGGRWTIQQQPGVSERRILASDLGYLAGLLDDSTSTSALRTQAKALAATDDSVLALFEARLADGRATIAGLPGVEVPDAASQLRRLIEDSPRRLRVSAVPSHLPDHTAASWDFCVEGIATAGATAPINLLETEIRGDEYESQSSFALLALPGVSQVELPFDAAAVPGALLILDIEAQKSVRSALPMDGTAALDVLVDSTLIAHDAVLPGSTTEHFRLPLCDASVPRHRLLTLRLSNRSSTTLRLYRVLVAW